MRLGGLKQRAIDVREQLLAYQKGEITKIDELEEEHLDFHYFDDSSIERLNYKSMVTYRLQHQNVRHHNHLNNSQEERHEEKNY